MLYAEICPNAYNMDNTILLYKYISLTFFFVSIYIYLNNIKYKVQDYDLRHDN
jgi:hypothetical protein